VQPGGVTLGCISPERASGWSRFPIGEVRGVGPRLTSQRRCAGSIRRIFQSGAKTIRAPDSQCRRLPNKGREDRRTSGSA
jgi:hypothetical protein